MSGKVAFVASPGGHIDQSFEISGRFAEPQDRFWITASTAQTEALLAQETVEWVPEIWSRQAGRAVRSLGGALRIMRGHRPRMVVSTGSALAVPYLVAARVLRIPVTYVESATRRDGPSVTGRITEWLPGVSRYYQSTGWNRRGWTPFGSIFDRYSAHPISLRHVQTALVTIGSEKFPFERALVTAREAMDDLDVAWQTGNTLVEDGGLPGKVRAWWPGDELAAFAHSADIVVTHAGVGSILMVLRGGRCPVVIPRMSERGEHIDNHQVELSRVLEERGVVVVARPGDDLRECIRLAAAREIVVTDKLGDS